ncbi:hypothetical protein BDQ94DRAFT_147614 [Aspergillus welwitschiae]|uniref:Uncharacterized protein n=1 Tax=Aspergillus welwitschiae TaxID=1341132 RepID=A0A3F3PWE5_9EURO|nr:hypothetical protein BDQ94DRAFT_147614 [Aspergillus welwitschiae]RDH31178.1 hypothetical protein BDQ94DRAFT_147614 [Aspergillus welwitschiae]
MDKQASTTQPKFHQPHSPATENPAQHLPKTAENQSTTIPTWNPANPMTNKSAVPRVLAGRAERVDVDHLVAVSG